MANHKSAIKRIRVNARRRAENRLHISRTRTEIKQARAAMDKGDAETSREMVMVALRALDKAAARGAIHKNNAARRKSRLMAKLNALSNKQ